MLQKSKRLLSIFMIAISLVCCLSVFTACKKGKGSSDDSETGGETPSGGDSSGGSTPAQTITLTAEMLTLEYETVVFDGTAKEPTVIVKNGETTIEATEYSVAYASNTNVGTASVTVSAKDDSEVIDGEVSKEFTITAAELPSIEEMATGVWTGSSVLPTVKIGSLVLGTDFDISWEYKENDAEDDEYAALDTTANNFVNEGYYRVTATGKGNYEGTKTAVYSIKQGLTGISDVADVTYDGDSHTPESIVVRGLNNEELVLGTDYELSYEYAPNGSNTFVPYDYENADEAFVSAGQYKIIATGKGIYGGTINTTFVIHGIELPDLQLTAPSTTFDGSAKAISYTIDGLTENVDYIISYEFRRFGVASFESYTNSLFVYAGEYRVVATGAGNYEGEQKEVFTINRASITPTVDKADYTFNAETDKISVTGNSGGAEVMFYYTADATIGASTANEGWEIYTPGMKLDAGLYYIYASVGVSNDYAAGISNIDTFEVLKDELKGIMSLNGLEVTYDGESHKPTFIINSNLNSNPLVEGTDYELEWKFFDTNNPLAPEVVLDSDAEFINVGQYTVTLKGLGNYDVSDPLASNMTTYFTIIPIDFDTFSISRDNWTYGETPTEFKIKATNTTGNSVLELEGVTFTYYYVKDGTSTEVEFTEDTELDAGFYYVIAKAKKDNYSEKKTAKKSSAMFEVRKAEHTAVTLSLTAENDVTTRELSGYDAAEVGGEIVWKYNTAGTNEAGNPLTDDVISTLEAGTYYVYAEITGMTNYEDIKTNVVQFVID